jgi:carotenoid cleavage dioxygenase
LGTAGLPHDRDESVLGVDTDGVANTAMVLHAGRLLALEEGHAPIAIDPVTLETLGPWTFAGALPRNMTAHPKLDPASGEMIAFANFPSGRSGRHVALYTVAPDGVLTDSRVIEGPYPALIHDFAITPHWIVVPFCPVTVSARRAMSGGPALAWEPDLGLQVALVPRRGEVSGVRWFSGPAAMAWHTVNAFEDGGRVIVDVCQQDAAVFPHADGSSTAPADAVQRLARWTLDLHAGGVLQAEVRNPLPCEYPRIDERFSGRRTRLTFVAACGGPGTGDMAHRAIASFDQVRGDLVIWHGGSALAVGEPVFAPRPGSSEEGDGWLLSLMHDETSGAAHLAVFEARDLAAGPIARAHVDAPIPMGFHGLWTPAAT